MQIKITAENITNVSATQELIQHTSIAEIAASLQIEDMSAPVQPSVR